MKKNNRRVSRNNKSKKVSSKNLCMLGINAAGLPSKLKSFEFILNDLNINLFFVQESKLSKSGQIKFNGSEKFDLYELNRKDKSGGGIMIGASKELKSVLIREGDDLTEVLVIEIELETLKIRCINGYGPQSYDDMSKKVKYWEFIQSEVDDAECDGAGILIEMDGNLWIGTNYVKGDPHEQNTNGRLLEDFLKKNKNLTLVNGLDLCEGTITRERKTVKGVERSVLDFVIVSDKVLPFLKKMKIDENKEHALSRYSKKNAVKESDHNVIILEADLIVEKKKPEREEYLNLKNE